MMLVPINLNLISYAFVGPFTYRCHARELYSHLYIFHVVLQFMIIFWYIDYCVMWCMYYDIDSLGRSRMGGHINLKYTRVWPHSIKIRNQDVKSNQFQLNYIYACNQMINVLVYLQIKTSMIITLLGPHPSKLYHNLTVTPFHGNLCFAKVFAPININSNTSTFMYVHITFVLLAYTYDHLSLCMFLVSFTNKIKLINNNKHQLPAWLWSVD